MLVTVKNQFKVVATTPDVCQVGCSAIPFDSFQSLDAQKQYALSVKARGYCYFECWVNNQRNAK
ncbi:Rhs family protein [Proteus mirabilis]|uniref:Rhs family protein n=1 Tax=Proteus mirabilis TaxID=584 RepID=A0A379GJ60_PROMI|nr:Rhs family protein [Proteus mirabilis]